MKMHSLKINMMVDFQRKKRNILKDYIQKHIGKYNSYCWWNDCTINGIDLGGKKILDVGCGTGIRTCYYNIMYKPKFIVGIDEWGGRGSKIESKNKFNNLINLLDLKNIKIIEGNILSQNFNSNSFDVIICSQVLHHIFSTKCSFYKDKIILLKVIKLFLKFHKWLKPSGIVVIEETNCLSMWRFTRILFKNINWDTKRKPDEWISALNKAGFKGIRIKYYVNYKLRNFKKILSNTLANFFLGSKYFIYAKK